MEKVDRERNRTKQVDSRTKFEFEYLGCSTVVFKNGDSLSLQLWSTVLYRLPAYKEKLEGFEEGVLKFLQIIEEV